MNQNGAKQSWSRKSRLRWSILAAVVTLGGCSGLSPPADDAGGGINLDYLFGVRRPVDQMAASLIDDPEYTEYLEWKRWQDFQAYQEWRRLREKEDTSGNATSN